MTTTAPRIYVACLASYNAGRLHGLWIDATTDVDAMQAEVDAMLRASPCPNVQRQEYVDADGAAHFVDAMTPADKIPADWRAVGEPFPSAEEWAIHDSEGLGDIGEYVGLEEVARRVAIVEAAEDRDIPPAVLLEAMSDMGADDADPESFIGDYYDGQAESWEAFCEERISDCYDVDSLPDWVRNYIDFAAMARDWRLSGDWSAYRAGDVGELYFFRTA